MNLFQDFEGRIRAAVRGALGDAGPEIAADLLDRITAEPPRDPAHGDIATNAPMLLAKPLGVKPREIALRIAVRLEADPDITSVQVAGPGYVNLRLSDAFWAEHLAQILRDGTDYGRTDLGGGESVNVEYVSANPTGPMHVGHCRGAVVGDAIANLHHAQQHG